MRRLLFGSLTSLVVTVGCSDEYLTGVEVQTAYSAVSRHLATSPPGTVVLVNGVLIESRAELGELDFQEIVRLEIIRGTAAQRLYGDAAWRGLVQIYTTRGADSTNSGYRP